MRSSRETTGREEVEIASTKKFFCERKEKKKDGSWKESGVKKALFFKMLNIIACFPGNDSVEKEM